jgi:hypothetical protein
MPPETKNKTITTEAMVRQGLSQHAKTIPSRTTVATGSNPFDDSNIFSSLNIDSISANAVG